MANTGPTYRPSPNQQEAGAHQMSDIEQNNEELKREPAEPGVDQTRRRLAGAAVGSGVLLTLTSRPVLANGVCLAPSGFQSGNLSRPNQGYTPCAGRTPGYWKEKNSIKQGAWAAAACEPGECNNSNHCNNYTDWHDADGHVATKFCDIFPCTGYLANYQYVPGSSPAKIMSLMQVMHLNGSQDPYQFGAHLVAAYLNAKSGKNLMPSVAIVLDIASSIAASGTYSPAPGVTWTREQVVTYLKTTMPL